MSNPHSHAAGSVTDIPAALVRLIDTMLEQRRSQAPRYLDHGLRRVLAMTTRAARASGYTSVNEEFVEDIMSGLV